MDIITLSLAKNYANKIAAGITAARVEGSSIILTLVDGTEVVCQLPTPKDGISVIDLSIDVDGSLLCHMSDGTTIDAGYVPTVDPDLTNYYTKEEIDNAIAAIPSSGINRLLYIPENFDNFDIRNFYITTDVAEHELTKSLMKIIDDYNNGIVTSLCIYIPQSNYYSGLFEFVYNPHLSQSNEYYFLCNVKLPENGSEPNYVSSLRLRIWCDEVDGEMVPSQIDMSSVPPSAVSDLSAVKKQMSEYTSGYDSTKTQVLKNINGTLTWVDDQSITDILGGSY